MIVNILCRPRSADYFMQEAKRMKHKADAMVRPLSFQIPFIQIMFVLQLRHWGNRVGVITKSITMMAGPVKWRNVYKIKGSDGPINYDFNQ